MKNLTVRNVPDDVYEALVAQARSERRSLQQQVLLLLEQAAARSTAATEAPSLRARRIRDSLRGRELGDTLSELRELRDR